MSELVFRVGPFRVFTGVYLPAEALALALGLPVAGRLPDAAPAILLGLTLPAFALAVGAATAAATTCRSGPPARGQVLRLLALRRNGGRFAFLFAVIAVAVRELALAVLAAAGIPMPAGAGAGMILIEIALLTVVARLMIDGTAGTPEAMRRALLGDRAAR